MPDFLASSSYHNKHGARGTILIRGTTFSCRVLTQIVKFDPRSELLEEFCYSPEKKLCNKKKELSLKYLAEFYPRR